MPPKTSSELHGENPEDERQDFIAEELAEVMAMDFADRLPYLREIFEDVMQGRGITAKRAWSHGQLEVRSPTPEGNLKHYILPGIPTYDGDIATIRETYDSQTARFIKSAHHDFIRVLQGHMWVVPKHRLPILQIGMSHCSALLADLGESILVAHISYSEREPFMEVMSELDHLGVPAEKRHVVGSLHDLPDYYVAPRMRSREEYIAAGIPEKNVLTFEYAQIPEAKHDMQGLTRAIITADGFHVVSYDSSWDEIDRNHTLADDRYYGEIAVKF